MCRLHERNALVRSGGTSENWSGLEALEARLLLSAIDLSVTTAQPLYTNDSPPAVITGIVSDNIADVTVTLQQGGSTVATGPAQTDGTGGWSFTLPGPDTLADGHYDLVVAAADGADSGELDLPDSLIVDTVTPTVSFDQGQLPATTAGDETLTGTYSDANISDVSVSLDDGQGGVSNFGATLDTGTLTWSVQISIADLADGAYTVTATATDLAGNSGTASGDGSLTIDTVAPTVSFDSGQLPATITADKTLTGTFSDANISSIVVTLDNGQGGTSDFNATLDTAAGTWSATVAVDGLAQGAYDVSAVATDAAGNSTTQAAEAQLTIASTQTVTLGAGTSKVTYVDADGTSVTVYCRRGDVELTLSGVDIAVTSSGAYSTTVTATGGVSQVDVSILGDTWRLAFWVHNQGDGLTTVNAISGSGLLTWLRAPKANLAGGIDMTGGIRHVWLHDVLSDILMDNSGTTVYSGATIRAHSVQGSQISMDYIRSIRTASLTDSDIEATDVGYLRAMTAFENTSVNVSSLTAAWLHNVQTDNGGTTFGIQTSTLGSLMLVQDGEQMLWNKDFTSGIGDFDVTLT